MCYTVLWLASCVFGAWLSECISNPLQMLGSNQQFHVFFFFFYCPDFLKSIWIQSVAASVYLQHDSLYFYICCHIGVFLNLLAFFLFLYICWLSRCRRYFHLLASWTLLATVRNFNLSISYIHGLVYIHALIFFCCLKFPYLTMQQYRKN